MPHKASRLFVHVALRTSVFVSGELDMSSPSIVTVDPVTLPSKSTPALFDAPAAKTAAKMPSVDVAMVEDK
jgi:hypothetical protein